MFDRIVLAADLSSEHPISIILDFLKAGVSSLVVMGAQGKSLITEILNLMQTGNPELPFEWAFL